MRVFGAFFSDIFGGILFGVEGVGGTSQWPLGPPVVRLSGFGGF